jgi:hypothetical protein
MTQEPLPKQRICGACAGLFIGDNLHSINYVHVSVGKPIEINKFRLQTCSKSTNPACLTKSLLANNNQVVTQRSNYNKGFLTSNEIDDIATTLLKERGITMSDRYIIINWIEGARKVPVSIDCKYSANTYIKGVSNMLSIIIEFVDLTNEGYLTFLRPELISNIDVSSMEFDLYEGITKVATGKFK